MKSLWILSAQRRLEVPKTLDTLTQTSVISNYDYHLLHTNQGSPIPETGMY